MSCPPLPPTSNALSSHERALLVRSSKKLSKVLGDVPRSHTESTWLRRKPTHLPPLLKLDDDDDDDVYHHRGPIAPSDTPSDTAQRRTVLERVRRKLGDEVPATAVFPTTPRTAVPRTPKTATAAATHKRSPRGRTRSVARLSTHADDARSVTFSISSDEGVHTVALSARVRVHSPHPPKTRHKHVYQTGALPPVPPIPAQFAGLSSSVDDEVGLVRPRHKLAAGSKIGGSDFKAARRAKREGRALNGTAEPGEMIEMVGFLW